MIESMMGLLKRFSPAIVLAALSTAQAGPLAVPPFPSPLPALGISIRDALSRAGLGKYDPVLLMRKGAPGATCPGGYQPHTFSDVNASGTSGRSSSGSATGSNPPSVTSDINTGSNPSKANDVFQGCISSNANASGYLNDLSQWLNLLAGAVLSQFTGPGMADFVFGDKQSLYLGELLEGLCEAWNPKDRRLVEILAQSAQGETANLLGETICSFSRTYNHILEVIRMAYIYGDAAVNTYISKVISGAVKAILEQPINNLKAEIVKGYNSLPFAPYLASFAKDAENFVGRIAAEIIDAIWVNARSRTNPYVDSTVAWLVGEGARLMEEAQSQTDSRSRITTSSTGTWRSGTSGDAALKLPPEKLAVVMASSSPRVLEQLQALGEKQEALRAQIQNRVAAMQQGSQKAVQEALEKAKEVASPTDPDVAGGLVKQSKQMVDERSLLIQLIEVNHVLASEQIKQEKRLESMLASMVEQSAMTNQLLTQEANKELETQIQALEEVKQQVLDAALAYASEITQASTVMDGVVNLIGSLGVERAGIVLTEEEFNRIMQNGRETIAVP